VEGEAITIRVSEKFTRSDNPDRGKSQQYVWDLPPRYIYEPTGKLTLTIKADLMSKRELQDKAGRPLEDQLNEAIIKMLVLAEEHKFERQLREDAERRHREEARKLNGPEQGTIDDGDLALFSAEYARLRGELVNAREATHLPDEASCRDAVNDLLVRVRLGER